MDSNPTHTDNPRAFDAAIRWWERKRLIYNLVAVSGGLLVVLGRGEVPNGISSYSDFMIILFWLFGANIFYTFGWVLEALLNYYFNTSYFGKETRRVLFVLGTIFSFFWMFLLTRSLP